MKGKSSETARMLYSSGRWRSKNAVLLGEDVLPLQFLLLGLICFVFGCSTAKDEASAKQDSHQIQALATSVAALPQLDITRRYALLVGIRTYPQPEYELPSPPEDLAATRTVLENRFGFPAVNILELPDAAATRDNVITAFRSHLAKAGPNGVAVFYFVGHGMQMDSNYSVQDGEVNSRDQALYLSGNNGKGTIILDDELNVLIRELKAKRVVIILDNCYSGTGAQLDLGIQSMRASPAANEPVGRIMSVMFAERGDPAELPAPGHFISDGKTLVDIDSLNVVFMAATKDTALAYSVKRWPRRTQSRTIFSYFLDENLKQSDGSRSFEDLIMGIQQLAHSSELCQRQWDKMCQVPQIHGKLAKLSLDAVLGPH